MDTSYHQPIDQKKLDNFREVLKQHKLEGYLLPHQGLYQSEDLSEREERLAWITGFTGSAGFAVISLWDAAVFVDGRYTLQAENQLNKELFQVRDLSKASILEWIFSKLSKEMNIGVSDKQFSVSEFDFYSLKLMEKNLKLVPTPDLVNEIWHDRPQQPPVSIWRYPQEYSGETQMNKCQRMANILNDQKINSLVISDSSTSSWLLNIRGDFVPNNTIVECFSLLHDDASVDLYINQTNLESKKHLRLLDRVTIHPIEDFEYALENLNGIVQFDPKTLPHRYFSSLQTIKDLQKLDNPLERYKAEKNSIQRQRIRDCHIRDAEAVIEFMAWLHEQPPNTVTELEIVHTLYEFRKQKRHHKTNSFDTIAGSGPNGAIVHYRVNKNTNRTLQSSDLLLLDSGSHYLDGTTDITRTISMGKVSNQQRLDYTLVLKSLINLTKVRWPFGTRGSELDAIARHNHWLHGKDYDHGTGHGVGQFMDVHESPYRISKTTREPITGDILISIEPGYYREGSYGIRLENLALTKKVKQADQTTQSTFFEFETVTLVPFDTRLIAVEEMELLQIEWLNSYHAKVQKIHEQNLSDRAKSWLQIACRPISE